MAKFKIGDKVKLKANVLPGRIYNSIELTREMKTNILGSSHVTVEETDDTDNTIFITGPGIGWWIGEDTLELYQEQPYTYQIGDIVRIKKREGDNGDYPFSFSDSMTKLAGTLCRISRIIPDQIEDDQEYKYFNGDYSEYRLEPLDSADKRDFDFCWHSSMFDPVEKPQEIQLQATSLKVGDLILICGILGEIRPSSVNYYLNFEGILDQEHLPCCRKLRELVPNFDEIADKFGTVCNTSKLFPEFETIDELMQFVQAINAEYNSKQPTILKKSENYEIRFQKPKAISKRGFVPEGNPVSSKKDKIAVRFGHLSYRVCHC